ncbi:MAG: ABC transporter permease [Defluviitaleaceae bacterium]|nr:ABC transporter permease [Defluviitaleaceae bacterium]
MYLLENIQLALEGLRANKMRSLLTMLGIIIGISAVIGIVTVGNSMTHAVTDQMQQLGATNIIVMVQERGMDMMQTTAPAMPTDSDLISDEMIEQFYERYNNYITAISLSAAGGNGRAEDGRLFANVSLMGVSPGFRPSNNLEMMSGRFINDGDVLSRRHTAVVSHRFVENMFPHGTDPLGQEVRVTTGSNIETFVIVGVYEYIPMGAGMGFGPPIDNVNIRTDMYIPVSTMNAINASTQGVHMVFTIMAEPTVDFRAFEGQIRRFFGTFYQNNPRFTVSTFSMDMMLNATEEIMGTLAVAVAVIAGISLIVGGVGVMNIMLVSVTERTREIGTRKALGARNISIRIQFVVEAIIICAIGGLLGVALGVIMGYMGSLLLGFPGFPSFDIIIIAVFFSMMIGLFFGYYPANKAAKLDPIEALRYE